MICLLTTLYLFKATSKRNKKAQNDRTQLKWIKIDNAAQAEDVEDPTKRRYKERVPGFLRQDRQSHIDQLGVWSRYSTRTKEQQETNCERIRRFIIGLDCFELFRDVIKEIHEAYSQ